MGMIGKHEIYIFHTLTCSNFINSKATSPVTRAVVVAIAGMIFPAIKRDVCMSASGICVGFSLNQLRLNIFIYRQ